MGTRGVFGFHKDGVDKIMYNHFDSYPSELGVTMKTFTQKHSIEEMRRAFDGIIMVEDGGKPTPAQFDRCIAYYNQFDPQTAKFLEEERKKGEKTEWYSMLRSIQGNPTAFVQGMPFMIDSKTFPQDSLFCEWGYIINLDKEVLEIYRGFQQSPQWNRFHTGIPVDGSCKYYNCQMVAEVLLKDVPTFDMEAFEQKVRNEEGRAWMYCIVFNALQKAFKSVVFMGKHDYVDHNNSTFHAEIGSREKIVDDPIIENNYRVLTLPWAIRPLSREDYRKLFVEAINGELMFHDDKKISITIYGTKEQSGGWKYLTPVMVRIRPMEEKVK